MAVVIGSFVFAAYICRVYQPAMDWAVTRNDRFLSGASKSLQSPLRVANILALTYLFAVCKGWPVIRLFHQAQEASYLAKMGRNSLPVFATGAVLAVIGDTLLVNAINYRGGYDFIAVATEATVVVCALFAMKMVADRFERKRTMRREVFDQSRRHLPVSARSDLFQRIGLPAKARTLSGPMRYQLLAGEHMQRMRGVDGKSLDGDELLGRRHERKTNSARP
jgi:hypothetical protein